MTVLICSFLGMDTFNKAQTEKLILKLAEIRESVLKK